ncbi:MAG: FHA domain-containing protein [Cyanobacteria bacterium J06638_20]
MPKLYCHFPDASYPTILDTDTQCIGYVWRVGRQPQHGDRIGLYFRGGTAQFVSGSHAAIRWVSLGILDEDDNELGNWQIMHLSKTNPTWRGKISSSAEMPHGQWQAIEDGDRIAFGDPRNWIVFRLYGDETLQAIEQDEGPATVNKTMEEAIAQQMPEIDNPWEAAFHTWESIRGMPWWQFVLFGVFVLVGLALWLLLGAAAL